MELIPTNPAADETPATDPVYSDVDDPAQEFHYPQEAAHVTDRHVYCILPTSLWTDAAQFLVSQGLGEMAFPSAEDGDSSILVAVNRQTQEIDAYLVAKQVVLLDNLAVRSGTGVSYRHFHELVRRILPEGELYYAAVSDDARGRQAAGRAGLVDYARLMYGVAGMGEAEDAVDRTSDRGGGELSGVPSGSEIR